jgi:membrane-associated protease RseP (regulator of RpoE activity)
MEGFPPTVDWEKLNQLDQNPKPFLGVTPDGNDSETGVKIGTIVIQSPAEKMGLMAGDRIIAMNGKAIRDFDELRQTISEMIPGDGCEITIIRDGNTMVLKGNIGTKNMIELDGYRIYKNDKGWDDQGQYNYDYEFDLDSITTMDSLIQFNLDDQNINIHINTNKNQLFLNDPSEQDFSNKLFQVEGPMGLEKISFIPDQLEQQLQVNLSSNSPCNFKIVVLTKDGLVLYSNEMVKLSNDFSGTVPFGSWEQGEYILQISQNNKTTLIKKLIIK